MLDWNVSCYLCHAHGHTVLLHCVLLAEALKPSSIQEETEIPLLSGRKKMANWDFFQSSDFSSSTFRIGGESLAVAQNTYAVSWFKGKELNLVFGLQLSMARIVSMVMDVVGPNRKHETESCSDLFSHRKKCARALLDVKK